MKYRDVIEIQEGFQASVNLEYDLNKIGKVQSYIPTEQSVRHGVKICVSEIRQSQG